MCTNGSGTNSVKPPVRACSVADAQQMARPVHRPVDVAEHDGRGRAQADRVRGLHDVEPLGGLDLVRADDGAHLVVEDLGGRAGQRAEAGALELGQEVGAAACRASRAPCHTSSGEKACTCMSGRAAFTRAADVEIGRAGVVGMDAALQADLGRAALPGLQRAARDLVEVEDRRAGRAGSRTACPWRRRRTGSGSSRCWCS